MTHTVYVKFNPVTEMTARDVYLKDVAQVYCEDKNVQNKCSAAKIKTIREKGKRRYIMSSLDIIGRLKEIDSSIETTVMGAEDYIIAYKPPAPPRLFWQWVKTVFVCGICFFGGSFAIMTFNNDASVTEVFGQTYQLVMGQESNGFSVLEISYSVGLALGITLFFNHIAAIRLNTDPTPLEVEMRLYEDNITKTLVAADSRKESGIDIT